MALIFLAPPGEIEAMSDCTLTYDDPNGTVSPGDVRDAVHEAATSEAPYGQETQVGVGINRGRGEVRVTIEGAGDAEWDEATYVALRDALEGVDDLGAVVDQDNAPYPPQRYEAAADTEDADETDAEADLEVDPGEHTVPELKEAIGDVDDAAVLEAALEAEVAGKDRTTAVRALTGRISVVEGEDGT